ncbi:MAG TPA: SRPBCC family protein [Nocardioides sp.]|nr:SRPBCC family protein [Nocardioides sp.]
MPGTPVPSLYDEVEIAAPPAAVWGLVGDVTRMAEWSPQVTSTRLSGEATACGLGTRFTNRNAHGELVWTTHGEIVGYEAERRLAFRVEENFVVWCFDLLPAADGTRLVQRREAPDGISDLSRDLTEGFLGGQEVFTAMMRDGMRETLARIKAAAESPH